MSAVVDEANSARNTGPPRLACTNAIPAAITTGGMTIGRIVALSSAPARPGSRSRTHTAVGTTSASTSTAVTTAICSDVSSAAISTGSRAIASQFARPYPPPGVRRLNSAAASSGSRK